MLHLQAILQYCSREDTGNPPPHPCFHSAADFQGIWLGCDGQSSA